MKFSILRVFDIFRPRFPFSGFLGLRSVCPFRFQMFREWLVILGPCEMFLTLRFQWSCAECRKYVLVPAKMHLILSVPFSFETRSSYFLLLKRRCTHLTTHYIYTHTHTHTHTHIISESKLPERGPYGLVVKLSEFIRVKCLEKCLVVSTQCILLISIIDLLYSLSISSWH